MSTFKIVVTAIFAVSFVVGVGLFAVSKGTSSKQTANLVVWGTVSSGVFNQALENSSLKDSKLIKISYIEKNASTFDTEFIEALADGVGPDVVIIRDDYVYKNRNRLLVIPYTNYTERSFKDSFIEAGEVFLSPEGVVALPFTIDPMVMYWNRDLFSNSLIAEVPKYWEDFYGLIEKTTKRDSNANVLQSTVAMGEWSNITNAKEIISMLMLQAGTPITSRTETGASSVLNSKLNYTIIPAESAINFYTQFSNPTSQNYTWNRSLPTSLNMFLSGKLATYIGFASEIFSIQQKNSNLNFDVTYVPQIREANKKTVFGRMHAVALVKQSNQLAGAFTLASALTETSAIKSLESITNLPPVRRSLVGNKPTDAFRLVFYNSALISSSWIDPDFVGSNKVFRDMIDSITSGRSRVSDAIDRADSELRVLLK
ncbi:MAG: multiple sugar transport system substrate-binding protein [Patescibacteria group bacterium]|jgi:ABC-type glycerol-3-phosphate transport system substrate-binding protein|nr:multiple sugar transport system substrate-binding protein [Patescibacteria group bacterium]